MRDVLCSTVEYRLRDRKIWSFFWGFWGVQITCIRSNKAKMHIRRKPSKTFRSYVSLTCPALWTQEVKWCHAAVGIQIRSTCTLEDTCSQMPPGFGILACSVDRTKSLMQHWQFTYLCVSYLCDRKHSIQLYFPEHCAIIGSSLSSDAIYIYIILYILYIIYNIYIYI